MLYGQETHLNSSILVQIQEISSTLATETDYVDWRRLLLALTWPIPTPTQAQLLETLQRFREMDQKNTGFVTREQYDRVGVSSPSVSVWWHVRAHHCHAGAT